MGYACQIGRGRMERLLNTYSGVAVVFFHNFRQSAMRITSGKQFVKTRSATDMRSCRTKAKLLAEVSA